MPDPIGEIIELKRQPSGIQRRPHARAARRVRHDLREPAQRDDRGRVAGHQERQRGASCAAAPRRCAVEPGARRGWCSAALAEAGLPAEAVQLVADHRPRRGRPPDRDARVRRRDHPARRQGPDRAHRARGQGAGDQAPRRQLPRLCRRRGRPRAWRCSVTDNAKTQKYSPCNAAESLLVHARAGAARFLPRIGAVFAAKGVEMRCDARAHGAARARVPGARLVDATEADWAEEYLAPIISIKVVDSARRGDRAHQPLRLAPHRRDPHRRTTRTRCASCARSIRRA